MDYRINKNLIDSIEPYTKLVSQVYKDYPQYQQVLVDDFKKTVNKKNPFFHYGQAESLLVQEKGEVIAHGMVIRDTRLASGIFHLGYFECVKNEKVAKYFFDNIKKYCIENNVSVLRGPVNFSTWQTFRASSGGEGPPFFTESYTPSFYFNFFLNNGFKSILKYFSTEKNISKGEFDNYEQDLLALRNKFNIKKVDKENFNQSIADIYKIASDSFKETISYVSISQEEFSYNMSSSEGLIEHSFIFILYKGEDPIAFCYAVPDFYDINIRRLIIKTIGVKKLYQGGGLGKLLLFLLNEIAIKNKFIKNIHSTMRLDNIAVKIISGKDRKKIRVYDVFELKI